MRPGAIQERKHLLEVFFKAMDGFGTETLPGLLPGLKLFSGLSLIFCFTNSARLTNTRLLIFILTVIGNVLEFVKPAALDLGLREYQFTGSLQTG